MTRIETNEKGQKVVVIDEISFSCKRKINWEGVEQSLKRFIGTSFEIDETGEVVYIGSEFPDEYANSKYSQRIYGTIGKAKANASLAIPELVKIATNILFQENTHEKHKYDAQNGWYRCTVRFSIPIFDDQGNTRGRNTFQGRLIIRHSGDGKKYLYDIIDIKKET